MRVTGGGGEGREGGDWSRVDWSRAFVYYIISIDTVCMIGKHVLVLMEDSCYEWCKNRMY